MLKFRKSGEITPKLSFIIGEFDLEGLSLGLIDELEGLLSYSEELGLNLSVAEDRFKWFLASLLF